MVLALCSVVRRCSAVCIAVGGASDVGVRAGCVRHTARWPVVALRCVLPARNDRQRRASSPHLPSTSGQVLC